MRRLAIAMSVSYVLPIPPSKNRILSKMFQRFPSISTYAFLPALYFVNLKNQFMKMLESSNDAVFKLHKADVPIVMGSDSVCAPSAIFNFHGVSSLREIELLGEAGLTPHEAIKAATVTPSKMLGLSHDIGTIEKNKIGDIIIVQDNPLENLKALRSIKWTVKNGVAHTPEEWMN